MPDTSSKHDCSFPHNISNERPATCTQHIPELEASRHRSITTAVQGFPPKAPTNFAELCRLLALQRYCRLFLGCCHQRRTCLLPPPSPSPSPLPSHFLCQPYLMQCTVGADGCRDPAQRKTRMPCERSSSSPGSHRTHMPPALLLGIHSPPMALSVRATPTLCTHGLGLGLGPGLHGLFNNSPTRANMLLRDLGWVFPSTLHTRSPRNPTAVAVFLLFAKQGDDPNNRALRRTALLLAHCNATYQSLSHCTGLPIRLCFSRLSGNHGTTIHGHVRVHQCPPQARNEGRHGRACFVQKISIQALRLGDFSRVGPCARSRLCQQNLAMRSSDSGSSSVAFVQSQVNRL